MKEPALLRKLISILVLGVLTAQIHIPEVIQNQKDVSTSCQLLGGKVKVETLASWDTCL